MKISNPIDQFSHLALRLIFTFVTILILFISFYMAYNVLYKFRVSNDQCAWIPLDDRTDAFLIEDIVPGGVADKAGLLNGDILLKIDGKEISSDIYDTTGRYPMNIINSIPYGGYAKYQIQRKDSIFTTDVQIIKVYDIPFIANMIWGIMFLAVGFVVVMTKPKGKTQRQFFYYSSFIMLIASLGNYSSLFVQGNMILGIVFLIMIIITRTLAPVYFINLFNYFPVYRKPNYFKYIFGALILINLIPNIIFFFRIIKVDLDSPYRLVFVNTMMIYFVAGLFLFTYRYFKFVNKERRKPLKPILYTAVVSILAYTYMLYVNTTDNMAIFLKPYLLLPSLLIITLPIAFGYSIFRYRLMDFEVVIKKSIIYGIITATIAAIYVLFVFGAGSMIGEILGGGQNQTTLSIIAILIIAFIFDPLKRFLQDWVDKVFYREKYNYQQALLDFSKTLPLQMDMKNIMNSVIETLSSAMHMEKLAVIVFDEHGRNVHVSKNIPENLLTFNGYTNGLKHLLQATKEPQNVALMRDESYKFKLNENELIMLESSGIELSVPMLLQDKLIGVINTGKKRSDNYYSQEDINLLFTVAGQAAIAIENARLYEKEKSLERVQHEMNLASQIQLEWLPKSSPVIPGYQIAGKTIPASIVGGDYFDFIQDEEKLIMCIGDVSGKGLPAALLMANLQAVLRSQSAQKLSPVSSISNTNKLLYHSSRDDMFITLFYCILYFKENKLIYTNAGHNYPVVIKKDGTIENLQTGGLVIGVEENAEYKENTAELSNGDILVLYSDGISEAMDKNENLYSESRLIQNIIKYRNHEPAVMINRTIKDVRDFSDGLNQFDDMTMVVCKKL